MNTNVLVLGRDHFISVPVNLKEMEPMDDLVEAFNRRPGQGVGAVPIRCSGVA